MEIFDRLGVHETDKQAVPALPMALYMPDGVTLKESFAMAPYNEPTPACPFVSLLESQSMRCSDLHDATVEQ